MIVWIIGLSGSGKTTLAQEVARLVRQKDRKIAIVDGDVVRELFQNDVDHSVEGRRRNADRISTLCQYLEQQDIDAVCAILSIFPGSRSWNRANIANYLEVFIDAPMSQLIDRDDKGIYGKYNRGEINNVVGMDIDFPIPEDPDIVIENNGDMSNLIDYAEEIANRILKT